VTATAPIPEPVVDNRRLGIEGIGPVVAQLSRRSLMAMLRIPATVIPVMVMPVFFTLAFSGAFSAITNLPGFPSDNVLNWMVPFAILQGAAFAGFGAAFGAGRDLENGFYDRLLLSPVPRSGLIIGPVVFSMFRAFIPLVTVLPIGYLGGARIEGGAIGLFVLVIAAVGTSALAALWGLGLTYRIRSQRAGALVQAGIFVAIFLSAAQVPLAVMTGWLEWVARRNPFTYVLQLSRQGFLGQVSWADTWPGLAALAGGIALLGWFAWRGFNKLTP
jgi:ABC-2 type transport system permease protein